MMAPKPKSAAFTMGLEKISAMQSALGKNAASAKAGQPMELPLDKIDEDPEQPRTEANPGFSSESIKEIGETIERRGVKTPISVRDNPDVPGRYIINHGARRFRGSKYAKKTTIPGFIDNDYTKTDQVIENLQRNDLTPREIAEHIGRELKLGSKKHEIATALGKSASYVSQHVTLLDLPDPIAAAFYAGRTNDVTVINELVKAFKNSPLEVATWIEDSEQEISRGSVKLLREFLDEKSQSKGLQGAKSPAIGGSGTNGDGFTPPGNSGAEEGQSSSSNDPSSNADDVPSSSSGADPKAKVEASDAAPVLSAKKSPAQADPAVFKKAIVTVKHDGRPGRLMLDRRPPAEGFAWIKYDEDGHEVEVSLLDVQLVAVVEA